MCRKGRPNAMLRFTIHLLVLLATMGSGFCRSQRPMEGLTQHTWRIEDGLPDQEIRAIAQTRDSYLWLGTPHGLVRFDGFHFTDGVAIGVPILQQFGVSCLLAAGDGSLWAGAYGGGIAQVSDHRVRVFGAESGLTTLSIRVLHQDASGNIWAGTDHGIFRLQGEHFVKDPTLKDPSVATIIEDGFGGLWFAGHRLFHYTRGIVDKVSVPAQQGGLRIRSLVLDHRGLLWIATPYGLLQRDASGVIRAVPGANWDVRTLFLDSQGRLWVGTAGNGLLVSSNGGSFLPITQNEPHASRVVLTSFADSTGELWVGTQAGLTRFSDTGMTLWGVSRAAESDYASVFIDSDQSVWLSAGSVIRLAGGREGVVPFPEVGGLRIRAAFRDVAGALWIGTAGHGAYRYDHGRVQNYSSELGIGFVTGFLQDPDGSVWISTDSGVARWQNGVVTTYQTAPHAPHQAVFAMAIASGGGLWTGTPGGLFLLSDGDYREHSISRLLGTQRIWSLHVDHQGALWIGAESGVYLESQGVLQHLPMPHSGNATRAVLSILEDTRGHMLVAEPATIYRFPREDVSNAKPQPGESSGQIAQLRLTHVPTIMAVARETGAELNGGLPAIGQVDDRGGAWYATHLGLVQLSAETPPRSDKTPPVLIQQITVDGTPLHPRTSLLTLQHSTHNLQIQASPVLLSSRTGLRLRRRLLGLDTAWSDLEPGDSSSYSGLRPGKYRFQVEASWPGEVKPSTTELEIVQLGPLWSRPWFLALCGLLVPLLVWGWHSLRIRQVSLRFQAIAEERNRVAREMHDTVLQGCIGVSSLLEGIALTVESTADLHSETQSSIWRSTLEYARDQITQTIQDARTAIWDLRRTEDLKDLGGALEMLLEEQTRAAGLRLTLSRQGPPLTLRPSVQHELFMATREAVFNAIAHAQASHLDVELRSSHSTVAIRVSDDGRGFDPAVQRNASEHFGLVSMQERLHQIGGSVIIDSAEGRGSSVKLTLPLVTGMVRDTATEGM
jgi:ligand-binding sensor domain-containing protein/two-component sensor histidine kinase